MTGAIVLSEEFQVTEARVWVELSVNVPVAVKRCPVATGIDGLKGLMSIETSPDGVSVPGW